ncbi:MAG: hypothetical protein EXQ94_02350 [Alphaproteobacteria bacterium]|nr:hypothetical protein [Alphaproteobacteria bacterium]
MAPAAIEALQAAHAAARDLLGQGRVADALGIYRRMAFAAPDVAWIQVRLGAVLLLGDDGESALRHFQALTARHPNLEDAWQGLGKALYDQRRCAEAVDAFSHAATLTDTPARALYHRGMAHLLVICEQGYGDVFQFVRFLPSLHGMGGDVVFECPAELGEVLAPVLTGLDVVPLRGREAPDTAFDCYVSLASLPSALGIRLPDLPLAYLAPSDLALRPTEPEFRVGVCWAGKPSHPQDLQRSMDPECLAPLAAVPGVTLVSLRKDPSLRPPLPGLCSFLVEPPFKLVDFMATARSILALDLVITVDTSVAHLAGALGRPVWLLLSAAGEWRWLIGRTDSPWYPTMRIFRQSRLGDWTGPIADARAALGLADRACYVSRAMIPNTHGRTVRP